MSVHARLIGYGICVPINESAEKVNNSLTGYFLEADKLIFIEETSNLKIKKGLVFGISYQLDSNRDIFLSRIIHPTLVNPAIGNSCRETTEEKYVSPNGLNFDYYRLEHIWEMIAGRWTFQVEQSGKLLLEKSFNLYNQ